MATTPREGERGGCSAGGVPRRWGGVEGVGTGPFGGGGGGEWAPQSSVEGRGEGVMLTLPSPRPEQPVKKGKKDRKGKKSVSA